jgi:hypothetical protein
MLFPGCTPPPLNTSLTQIEENPNRNILQTLRLHFCVDYPQHTHTHTTTWLHFAFDLRTTMQNSVGLNGMF